ncbi:MAG: hypothetical protein M5U28_53030 [Sandaracinaceae bacterium]|nr:hypothetical protein [Sandaracinaceae bacterium]
MRRITADRRRALVRALLALVGFGLAWWGWSEVRDRVRAYARGEIDLEGEPRYEPPHPVDRRALARIDFAAVHAQHIPAWSIAISRATTPGRRRYADRMYEALAAEVAPDRNLSALLASSHRALREDPIEHAHELDYLLWAYNHYLDENDVPWRIEASLALGEERAIFRTMSYEVLADATTEGHRLRLIRRADRTNSIEGWLGHTRDDEGALVVMQRVLHFTVRHVWPALHPALDERRPAAERSWLPFVREEVRAALPEATYRLLSETAVDQQAMIEVAEAVRDRRACGSTFSIAGLPYNGMTNSDREALQRALAYAELIPECPPITVDEAARLVGASERLESNGALADAIERLAMVVARSVAAHELQHAADGEEVECPGCPKGLVGIARAEVSAYLGAFASEEVGYLALFQACATPRGRGLHGAALGAVLEELLPYGCEGPPLHGLQWFATRIERQLFGKRARVELPALPARVALLPRRTRPARPPTPWRPLESGWGVAVAAD